MDEEAEEVGALDAVEDDDEGAGSGAAVEEGLEDGFTVTVEWVLSVLTLELVMELRLPASFLVMVARASIAEALASGRI